MKDARSQLVPEPECPTSASRSHGDLRELGKIFGFPKELLLLSIPSPCSATAVLWRSIISQQ